MPRHSCGQVRELKTPREPRHWWVRGGWDTGLRQVPSGAQSGSHSKLEQLNPLVLPARGGGQVHFERHPSTLFSTRSASGKSYHGLSDLVGREYRTPFRSCLSCDRQEIPNSSSLIASLMHQRREKKNTEKILVKFPIHRGKLSKRLR